MKPLLTLGAFALLGSLRAFGAAGVEPAQRQARATTETPLPYSDMIRAYESGRLDEARRLARQHLARANDARLRARTDREKESAVSRTLGVAHSLLAAEVTLAPRTRLGGDLGFLRSVRDTLIDTRRTAGSLTQVTQQVQRFITRELGTTAQLWLGAAAVQLPRAELTVFYDMFREELQGVRVNSFDRAIAEPPAGAPDTLTASAADEAAIVETVRDYLLGLAAGDRTRLGSATGLDPSGVATLITGRDESYRREGLRAIATVTVPEQRGLTLLPLPGRAPSTFAFTIHGIVLEVVRLDGTRNLRTIDQQFRARKNAAGRWTLMILT